MFQFPSLTSSRISARRRMGCPIRIPADLRFYAAPRSFSQLYTSFIVWLCQGIHHTPLTCFHLYDLHHLPAGKPSLSVSFLKK